MTKPFLPFPARRLRSLSEPGLIRHPLHSGQRGVTALRARKRPGLRVWLAGSLAVAGFFALGG